MATMTVKVHFRQCSVFGAMSQTYEHITEVHYNYPSSFRGTRVAFESDVDCTGYTHDMADIESIEITVDAAPTRQ